MPSARERPSIRRVAVDAIKLSPVDGQFCASSVTAHSTSPAPPVAPSCPTIPVTPLPSPFAASASKVCAQ